MNIHKNGLTEGFFFDLISSNQETDILTTHDRYFIRQKRGTMRILSIGNSFSQDATHYLHQIARADNVDLDTVNLFIGGCSLQTHYLNILGDNPSYELQLNGSCSSVLVSIRQALIQNGSSQWDAVTIQQVSHLSPHYETYRPYADLIVKEIRKYCPHTKIFIHQTWAYEDGCVRMKELGYSNAASMFADIQAAYAELAQDVGADGIIPSGQVMQEALKRGIPKVHRDSFHASLGLGRYLLGLTWYRFLTGRNISMNSFHEFDQPIPEREVELAKEVVLNIV